MCPLLINCFTNQVISSCTSLHPQNLACHNSRINRFAVLVLRSLLLMMILEVFLQSSAGRILLLTILTLQYLRIRILSPLQCIPIRLPPFELEERVFRVLLHVGAHQGLRRKCLCANGAIVWMCFPGLVLCLDVPLQVICAGKPHSTLIATVSRLTMVLCWSRIHPGDGVPHQFPRSGTGKDTALLYNVPGNPGLPGMILASVGVEIAAVGKAQLAVHALVWAL